MPVHQITAIYLDHINREATPKAAPPVPFIDPQLTLDFEPKEDKMVSPSDGWDEQEAMG